MELFMKDLYPNFGIDETSTMVQPDATDQHALVDDQNIADKINTAGTPGKMKIFGAVGLIVGIAFLFSIVHK